MMCFFAEVVNPLVFNGSAAGTCGPTLSVNVNASTTCPQFGTPTYQWQLSTDNGSTYAATGSSFSSIPNTITAGNTAGSVRYRLNILDGACNINTTPMYFNDIGSLCVLPVTGLEFSGKHTNNNAELRWDIQSEARIVRYELERSLDGKIFFQLTQKNAGAGNTYTYNDADGLRSTGTAYYRLRLIYDDNQSRFSNVLKISSVANIKGLKVELYPNPVRVNAGLTVLSETDGISTIRVVDKTGKQLMTVQQRVRKGSNSITVPGFDRLTDGLYFIETELNGQKVLTRAMVMHQ